jgi:protein SCO1
VKKKNKRPLVAVSATRDGWRRNLLLAFAIGAALLLVVGSAARASGRPGDAPAAPAPAQTARTTSVPEYPIPPVRLTRDDGKVVSFFDELNDGRPVVLNFIFTTCSSICPLMSQTLAQFDSQLGADAHHVHLMSISIDPEEDTPARLREYAQKFHAGPEWQHYTGTIEASLATQRAFNATIWRGDKMGHTPLTLLRAAPGQPWLRIEGFVTPTELVKLYRQQLDHATPSSVAIR